MWRELDQLLTPSTGNGVLVQISIKSITRIGNVLINVTLCFARLTVVVVKKAISIKHSDCVFVGFVIQHTKRMRLNIFSSVVVCVCFIFYIVSNNIMVKKNWQRLESSSWILKMFAWNISYFRKKWRDIGINEWFCSTVLRNIPFWNFMTVRRMESDLSQSVRQT